jgi:hypothetical protein
MSKSPTQAGTNTTTTVNEVPAYVQAAQQNLLGTAQNLTSPFTSYPLNYSVAGFNPDQEMAFDLARVQAQQAYTQPPANIESFGSYTAAPASIDFSSLWMNTPALTGGGQQATAALSDAAQLDAGDIQNLFNPYQTSVVDTTTQQLEEANARQLASIRARQAAESAYGGNRGALQESEQNRNFGNTLASTVAGLNYGGWNTAANLGMQNTQLEQQTGLANQQAQQQVALANQMANQQAMLANQANEQLVNNQNVAAINQALGLNAGYQQQANLFNAQQPFAAAQAQTGLESTDWQQQMQTLQALLGTGGTQQQLAQQSLTTPFTALQYLSGVTPGNYGSTSSASQPIYGPSTFQSILPLASIAASAFGFSDKTMKKDMKKMGKDPHTDLNMYAYRYKGAPKGSPKHLGPMAQEVEKKYPGSTGRAGGKMFIKGAARKMLGI